MRPKTECGWQAPDRPVPLSSCPSPVSFPPQSRAPAPPPNLPAVGVCCQGPGRFRKNENVVAAFFVVLSSTRPRQIAEKEISVTSGRWGRCRKTPCPPPANGSADLRHDSSRRASCLSVRTATSGPRPSVHPPIAGTVPVLPRKSAEGARLGRGRNPKLVRLAVGMSFSRSLPKHPSTRISPGGCGSPASASCATANRFAFTCSDWSRITEFPDHANCLPASGRLETGPYSSGTEGVAANNVPVAKKHLELRLREDLAESRRRFERFSAVPAFQARQAHRQQLRTSLSIPISPIADSDSSIFRR